MTKQDISENSWYIYTWDNSSGSVSHKVCKN